MSFVVCTYEILAYGGLIYTFYPQVNPAKRFTASQALESAWIESTIIPLSDSDSMAAKFVDDGTVCSRYTSTTIDSDDGSLGVEYISGTHNTEFDLENLCIFVPPGREKEAQKLGIIPKITSQGDLQWQISLTRDSKQIMAGEEGIRAITVPREEDCSALQIIETLFGPVPSLR